MIRNRAILIVALALTTVMAANVGLQYLFGSNAGSEAPNGNFSHYVTIQDINLDKCYWENTSALVETKCTDPKPDNAEVIVKFIAGSNATNYTLWADEPLTNSLYCDLYILDENSANRLVPVGYDNRITVCSDCTKNLSIYGYVVFDNIEGIEPDDSCYIDLKTEP